MKANGLAPNAYTISMLFNGLSRNGNPEAAVELFEEEMRKGFKIEGYTCSILCNVLCKDGKVSRAEEVLERLVKKGLVPTIVIYITPVDGYCRIRDVDGAFAGVKR